MLYAGWDKTHGFQLYLSDPSGNYNGWKATCIGANEKAATSLLKQEYKASAPPRVCTAVGRTLSQWSPPASEASSGRFAVLYRIRMRGA